MRTRTRIVCATTAVIAAAATATAYGLRDPSPVGYWRSAGAQDRYTTAYDEAMRTLPAPSETRDVTTLYGTVRTYRFDPAQRSPGTPAGPPVVLLPGRSSGVPMWSATLPGLLRTHTVYAFDAIGDAGRSVQARPLESADDQAAWVAQTLDALRLDRIELIGHSFGGAAAAGFAVRHPERVDALVLLEPILTFVPLQWRIYLDTLPSALPFLPESWRRAGLNRIGGASDDAATQISPIARMIDAGAAGYVAKLPTPQVLSDQQRTTLTMPVLVALGGRSAVSDPDAGAAVARTLPNATVRVWPEASHSLPMEVADELDPVLAGFLAGRA